MYYMNKLKKIITEILANEKHFIDVVLIFI